MGYSNFKTLKKVVQDFDLDSELVPLFKDIKIVEPSKKLGKCEFFPLTNEKSKSERLVSPLLLEVAIHYKDRLTFFQEKI